VAGSDDNKHAANVGSHGMDWDLCPSAHHLWFLVRARRTENSSTWIFYGLATDHGPRASPWDSPWASNNLYNQQLKCGSARGRALSEHCLATPPFSAHSSASAWREIFQFVLAANCKVLFCGCFHLAGKRKTKYTDKATRFQTAVNFNCALKITPLSQS